jgi:hypothetical protein
VKSNSKVSLKHVIDSRARFDRKRLSSYRVAG